MAGRAARTFALGAACVAAVACADSPTAATPADPCLQATSWTVRHDLRYANDAGVDPDLLSLDVHQPVVTGTALCAPRPVLLWVHGGDWRGGDKGDVFESMQLMATQAGYLLVSVNYRLSPVNPDEHTTVVWPVHGQDVARAVRWVEQHIGDYGGDPTTIALVGFSAGAQIVAALGTDPGYLTAAGANPVHVKCVASLDISLYDIPAYLASAPQDIPEFSNIFTENAAVWASASAGLLAREHTPLGPFLVVVRGDSGRRARQLAFVDVLRAVHTSATPVDVGTYAHTDVFYLLGRDSILTPPVRRFLTEDCRH